MNPQDKPDIYQAHVALAARIASAVIAAVKESGPQGAPGGALFAAMQAHGCTQRQFDQIMKALCDARKLRREEELYFYVAPLAGRDSHTAAIQVTRPHDCDGCGQPMAPEDKDETLCPKCKSGAREGSC